MSIYLRMEVQELKTSNLDETLTIQSAVHDSPVLWWQLWHGQKEWYWGHWKLSAAEDILAHCSLWFQTPQIYTAFWRMAFETLLVGLPTSSLQPTVPPTWHISNLHLQKKPWFSSICWKINTTKDTWFSKAQSCTMRIIHCTKKYM